MSIDNRRPQVTADQLNSAYIRLIKMVLNGSFSASSPYINQFYRDPSPTEAYSLLNKILNQSEGTSNQNYPPDASGTMPRKNQLKRAFTYSEEQQREQKMGEKIQNIPNEFSMEIKQQNIFKAPEIIPYKPIHKQVEESLEAKSDRLRRITAKVTQIFTNNHSKIQKYQELARHPATTQFQYRPMEADFKKY